MKPLLVMLLLVISLCCGCGAPAQPSYTSIPMEEAVSIIEGDEPFILLDVRTQEEFDQGHIPGAICIPNESILSEQPAQLPDLNQRILVYCRSGNRSKQAAQKLAELGYTDIVEIGGILSWTGEVVS